MAVLTYEHHYYGEPYKLFKDLEDSDYIYLVDYKSLEIKPIQIYSVKVTDVSDYWSKDRFKVTFETSDIQLRHGEISNWDGNSFIMRYYDGDNEYFFTTDKRIGEMMIDIMKFRNAYQWKSFTSLFGNPMSRYADKPVILGNHINLG